MKDALLRAFADRPLSPSQLRLMELHWELMLAWNRRTNLTAVEDPVEAAWLHYRDSIEPAPFVKNPVVDIGSGAGFPGIPLAILGFRVTLLEPRQKRVSFLRTVRARLGLDNLTVLEGRSDDTPRALFQTVVTRATFASHKDLLACRRWLKTGGNLIALRSEPATIPAPDHHHYALQGKQRILEFWPNP